MEQNSYNYIETYCNRTKHLAVQVVLFYAQYCKKSDELHVISKQLLRSSTSIAANFRAFARGRSTAEKYSKLCIVVEEIDETVFWIEILSETNLIEEKLIIPIKDEAEELLKVLSVSRKNFKTTQ